MILGKVVGNVWSAKKDNGLKGHTFLIIEVINPLQKLRGNTLVAADNLGAGEGDLVLVSTNNAVNSSPQFKNKPIDAVVVAIVDDYEVPSINLKHENDG